MEVLDQPSNEQRNASDGNRILAYIIDILIMIPISLIPILGYLVIIAYTLLRDALPFLDGQSIGKKVMKIRAVTEDGQPLTNNWGASAVRNIPMVIPIFPLVELIVLLTNQKKQRLGDQWAKTRVVEAR